MVKSKLALLSILTGVFLSGSVLAADGKITINGKVTDTTCSVSVNGGGNDATITLPTVSTSALSGAGVTAGDTPFTISLTNCTGTTMNTASTYFEPGAFVDTATGRLNIDTSVASPAENVQVELLNSALSPIIAGNSVALGQNDIPVDISGGNGTLEYYARYYATAQAAAGAVTTQIDYTIVYD